MSASTFDDALRDLGAADPVSRLHVAHRAPDGAFRHG